MYSVLKKLWRIVFRGKKQLMAAAALYNVGDVLRVTPSCLSGFYGADASQILQITRAINDGSERYYVRVLFDDFGRRENLRNAMQGLPVENDNYYHFLIGPLSPYFSLPPGCEPFKIEKLSSKAEIVGYCL